MLYALQHRNLVFFNVVLLEKSVRTKIMSKYRTSAMAWWKYDLAKFEQQEFCDKYYKGRLAHTLTGSEIEKIWKIK